MPKSPPPLPPLNAVEFRQRLAGLIDPHDAVDKPLKMVARENAIRFLSTLPLLFGDSLDRMTLWDRIATGVEVAAGKCAPGEYEAFIGEVLKHIQAARSRSARQARLLQVMDLLEAASDAERMAWIDLVVNQIDTLLVHARREWERYKAAKAAKVPNSDALDILAQWQEQLDTDDIIETEVSRNG